MSGPERFESVCVDLSTVAALELDFDGTELPFTLWPFTLVTVLSDSWLEIVKKIEIKSHTGKLLKHNQHTNMP